MIASVSDGAIQLCNGGCQLATRGEAFHVPAANSEAVLIFAPPIESPPVESPPVESPPVESMVR